MSKQAFSPKGNGRELNKAFENRQIGDYEYTFVIAKQEAEEILGSGRNVIQDYNKLEVLKEDSFIKE